jgi:hypothetical protein
MSDEGKPSGPAPAQEELIPEILRRVRRSQSRRLADFYNNLLSRAARKKSAQQEDLEWQSAAKPNEIHAAGWGACLKKGALYALPFVVGPLALLLTGYLFPHARRAIKPESAANFVVACILLAPIAFTIGVHRADK